MRTIIAAAAIALAGMSVTGADPAFSQTQSIKGKDGTTWWKCADEEGLCRFRDKRRVAYGVPGRWQYRIATHSIACNSVSFGGDPAVGVRKACYYESESELRPLSAVDSKWIQCAGEGHVCQFQGERRVAFGARGRWSYRIARNNINCTVGRFGDPIQGVVKACYIDPYY
ncbi:MAG: hypothetical protein JNK75_00260 [Betaproteobacteria bacterium]|nr:hypothetical protein [Betaproteobacteria bacterium]